MFSRNRRMTGAVALTVIVLVFSVSAYAGIAEKETSPSPATQSATESQTNVTTSPPTETPTDARALTPEEVATYQTNSDSTMQNSDVQQMNVGMSVDGTLVLSILVALVIFAVLVAVL